MDNDPMRDDLRAYLPASAREEFRRAIDRAYQDTGSRFEPNVGSDAQWFGYSVWKFGEYRLKQALASDKLPIRDASSGGQFRIGFGPFVMAAYPCGHTVPEDPWKEFPNNDKGAGFLSDINTGQFSLKIDGFEERPAVATVLAHYGNHETGLEALYLKVPCAQTAGRISRWSYVEELWRIGGSAVSTPPPRRPILPGPARIEKPQLPFRKPIKKTDTGSA
jgi:hypothetical protein